MSSFDVTSVRCPHCEHVFECGTAVTLNVTRTPWAKEHILSGELHRYDCPSCGAVLRLERPFVYTDFGDDRFVQVLPLELVDGWPEHEDVTEQALHDACADGVTYAATLPGRFRIRTCFGILQLADKLRIWDAGLDDAVVELLKLELLMARPELQTRPGLELTVDAVDLSRDVLIIEAWNREGDRDVVAFEASLVRYRELDHDKVRLADHFPGLFNRPFRSFRRLARERVSTIPPVEAGGQT